MALQERTVDRYFYAGMAWLLVLVTLAGFAPRSIAIIGGAMPNPPLVVHMHAFVMLAWTVLLALQASLSSTNRMDLHRRLGMLSLAVAPMLLVMLTLVTAVHMYLLLLPVPALVFDFVRLGRVHPAWLWGYGLTLPWVVATEFIWNSAWWLELGPRLVGAG